MLHPDYLLRQQRLQSYMQEACIDALVLSSNVALLYVYGQVFAGLAVLLQQGEAHYFVRRPQTQPETSQLHHIRKIEQLPEWLDLKPLRRVALEQDEQSYSDVQRMARIFEEAEIVNAAAPCPHGQDAPRARSAPPVRSTTRRGLPRGPEGLS